MCRLGLPDAERFGEGVVLGEGGQPPCAHGRRVAAATTTRTGLTVHAELDTRNYPNGIKITDQQMEGLEQRTLRRHDLHGEWTYTLVPQRTHDPP